MARPKPGFKGELGFKFGVCFAIRPGQTCPRLANTAFGPAKKLNYLDKPDFLIGPKSSRIDQVI